MTPRNFLSIAVPAAALLSACGGGGDVASLAPAASPPADTLARATIPQANATRWLTVANSATVIPDGGNRKFNSFNQPSVNAAGLVVLRGRSKGGQGGGEPARGLYQRDMAARGPLTIVFDTATTVPSPNNIEYQNALGTFTEFPAFPRIGIDSTTIVSRAQSKPVWQFTLADGTETRVGTSGVYALHGGQGKTAASQLGQVPGFEYFSVPGAAPSTKFDQFPGAPAVASRNLVVFKGNYTEGLVAKTGVFFRSLLESTPPAAVQVIANSDTLVPGQPEGGVRFGSTAPPSAAGRYAVFLGVDNEEAPTLGGIYRAPLASRPALQSLVAIGAPVPGEAAGAVFTRLGEALSFDGRFVSFWGAWGAEMRSVTLTCPTDGQAAVIAFCNAQYPAGLAVEVPAHQGIFVHELRTGRTFAVAKTGTDYLDFMYWTFSGRPPGVGDSEAEDFEPPRWRASAFSSAFAQESDKGRVAFKARRTGATPIDGIYVAEVKIDDARLKSRIAAAVETGMAGRLVDPAAPADSLVTTVGLERDGLRNGWLALAIGMLNPVTSEGWAGVYVTRLGDGD